MKSNRTFPLVAAFLVWTLAPAIYSQEKPTADQVKEIQDKLDKIKEAEKAGNGDDVKKLKQEAIQLADKYYKIPQDNLDGEPKYDPKLTGPEGETTLSPDNKMKVKVRIGEKAFKYPGLLASVKIHEIVGHGAQAAGGRWYKGDKGDAINDIEAYDQELKNADKTGLSKEDIEEVKKRRQALYDSLSDENKKKIDRGTYTLALAPASERSQGALAGKAEVFVAGEVTSNEGMAVTVRGPNTLVGTVVTAEVEGKTVRTQTDRQGHAIIDFAALAGGVAGGTIVLIRALDSTGKEISRAQTKIDSAPPQAPTRPQIPSLPALMRNGDVVTIQGQHLGAESQLVIGNRFQETLAASSKELTAFVDAPSTGAQPAFVLTPNGESQSQTVACYDFKVQAPQTTILRGQHVVAVAQYAGLPPGSRVAFTNASPDIVSMKVPGGAATGTEQSTVTILQPAGSIQVELTGKVRGNFAINYDVLPPQTRP